MSPAPEVVRPIVVVTLLGRGEHGESPGSYRLAIAQRDWRQSAQPGGCCHQHDHSSPRCPILVGAANDAGIGTVSGVPDTGMELVTDTPGVPEQHQPGQPQPRRTIDRTISATCQIHGAKGFCSLRVTRAGGGIVLDPHVGGACVITLDEAVVAALRDLLIEWQGRL